MCKHQKMMPGIRCDCRMFSNIKPVKLSPEEEAEANKAIEDMIVGLVKKGKARVVFVSKKK